MFFAKRLSFCFAAAGLIMLSACGGGSSGTGATTSTGTAPATSNATSGGSTNTGSTSTVNNVVISWTAPTQNSDGSSLNDLAGYKIYYGISADDLSDSVSVDANSTTHTMNGFIAGTTYYFAIASQNSAGVESALSAVVSKTV